MDQDIMQELRAEAIDAAEDKLASLQKSLADKLTGIISDEEFLSVVRLDAHSLKAVAASFEMKALKVMCHRFEDYFFNVTSITDSQAQDVQFFIDRLTDCLDAFVNCKDIDTTQMMRALPNKAGFDVSDITVSDIEVMLVMEPGTATKIVTRELMECGYRMINVASTIDALQLIPAMGPDAVVVSKTMPELSGIDLVCALRAMPLTKKTPVALLTTSNRKSGDLKDLPDDVPVLRKSASFADDVADAFVSMGIL